MVKSEKKDCILLAHNERMAREMLARDLSRKGYAVRASSGFDTLWRWIRDGEGDLVLIDVDIADPARNGFELLKQIRQAYPQLPVMILSAENTVLTSLLAARFGANDYFPKPFSVVQLLASISRALQKPVRAKTPQKTRVALPLIGRSPCMQKVYRQIAQAAQSDLPLLITGETGTGKSLVAKVIHEFGKRAEGSLTVQHFPTSDAVLEQTLSHQEGGTLLLDEISALTQAQSAALIGHISHFANKKNAPRLICTSRAVLANDGKMEGISPELQFRINVLYIKLPPLREREDDYEDLAIAFAAEFSKDRKVLSETALRSLSGRAWPGNVLELRNLVQSAVLMAQSAVIDQIYVQSPTHDNVTDLTVLEESIERALVAFLGDFDNKNLPENFYTIGLEAFERPLLKRVMALAAGNQLKAAEMLGINRNTLHKKLTRYALKGQPE